MEILQHNTQNVSDDLCLFTSLPQITEQPDRRSTLISEKNIILIGDGEGTHRNRRLLSRQNYQLVTVIYLSISFSFAVYNCKTPTAPLVTVASCCFSSAFFIFIFFLNGCK